MIIYSKVTEQPDSEPVNLDEVKVQIKVDGTDEDEFIASKIKVARRICERYAGLSFITQTRTVSLDRFYGRDIILPYGPVTAIESFDYKDSSGVDQTIDEALYTLDTQSDLPKIRVLDSWPSTDRTLNNVVITYTAGYADADSVPEEVKEAILKTVARLYEKRGDGDDGQVLTDEIIDLLDTVKVYWNANTLQHESLNAWPRLNF